MFIRLMFRAIIQCHSKTVIHVSYIHLSYCPRVGGAVENHENMEALFPSFAVFSVFFAIAVFFALFGFSGVFAQFK